MEMYIVHRRCRTRMKIKNSFWIDVLKGWSKYNAHRNNRIENQIIWYNSHLRIQQKPFMWKDTYQWGLKYVHQLFEGCKFRPAIQLWEDYGLTQLRYNSLKCALPASWKSFFTTHEKSQYFPLPPLNFDTSINNPGSLSTKIYKEINGDILHIVNKYRKWESDLGEEITEGIYEFAQLHTEIYKVTNVPKLRSFQYRLLQRGLVTNIQLKSWNLAPSDLCSFCQSHRETVEHLMFHCSITKTFWQELEHYVKDRYGVNSINLNVCSIIRNNLVPQKRNIINLICLASKAVHLQAKMLLWQSILCHLQTICQESGEHRKVYSNKKQQTGHPQAKVEP